MYHFTVDFYAFVNFEADGWMPFNPPGQNKQCRLEDIYIANKYNDFIGRIFFARKK